MESNIPFIEVIDRHKKNLLSTPPAQLTNAQLLGIFLGFGNDTFKNTQLAKNVLGYCGNRLSEIGNRSVTDLMKVPGIKRNQACRLIAINELCRRIQSEKAPNITISNTKDAAELFAHHLKHMPYECFALLYLSSSGKLIKFEILFENQVTRVLSNPEIIASRAFTNNVPGIMLGHNHPSGLSTPSFADEVYTIQIKDALKKSNVRLLDHIIVTETGYYSFSDNGKLNQNSTNIIDANNEFD